MTYDVVVVGAGPAGATAAKFLAEKGTSVLLIDKHTFPREKPCGGMLSVRTLKRFPYILRKVDTSYSHGGTIYSASRQNHLHIQKDEPIAMTVLRKDFDHGLVKAAVESGAELQENDSVVNTRITNEKALVKLSNGETLESQLLIGADGVWSVVAKTSGLGHHYPSIGRCLYQEIPLSDDQLETYYTKKRHFQLYLKFLGINGFGWIIPKNNSGVRRND